MPDILIRDVPDDILESLKEIAARDGRSLQQELRIALERLARAKSPDPVEAANRIRRRLELKYGRFSDSTELIRKDRDKGHEQ